MPARSTEMLSHYSPGQIGWMAGSFASVATVLSISRTRDGYGTGLPVISMGLATGALAYLAARQSAPRHDFNDDAPARTRGYLSRYGDYAVTGRTVTINRPRNELYAFWRDFTNLPAFMENVLSVDDLGGGESRWEIAAPAGLSATLVTRLVTERENELLAWRSTDHSDIETEGRVKFTDAPGGRGTWVEAIVAYKPPAGEVGRLIAKLFRREPGIQGRHELKRFKMLMETGEIATSRNRRDAF